MIALVQFDAIRKAKYSNTISVLFIVFLRECNFLKCIGYKPITYNPVIYTKALRQYNLSMYIEVIRLFFVFLYLMERYIISCLSLIRMSI